MFDKNYKKAMENVKIDEQTKEKIFDKSLPSLMYLAYNKLKDFFSFYYILLHSY